MARTRRGLCTKLLSEAAGAQRRDEFAAAGQLRIEPIVFVHRRKRRSLRVEPAPVQKFCFVLRNDPMANVVEQILAAAAERQQTHVSAIEDREAHRSRQIKLDDRSGGILVAELVDAVTQPRGQPGSIRITAIHDGIEKVRRLVIRVESKRFPHTTNIGDFDTGPHHHRRAPQAFAQQATQDPRIVHQLVGHDPQRDLLDGRLESVGLDLAIGQMHPLAKTEERAR